MTGGRRQGKTWRQSSPAHPGQLPWRPRSFPGAPLGKETEEKTHWSLGTSETRQIGFCVNHTENWLLLPGCRTTPIKLKWDQSYLSCIFSQAVLENSNWDLSASLSQNALGYREWPLRCPSSWQTLALPRGDGGPPVGSSRDSPLIPIPTMDIIFSQMFISRTLMFSNSPTAVTPEGRHLHGHSFAMAHQGHITGHLESPVPSNFFPLVHWYIKTGWDERDAPAHVSGPCFLLTLLRFGFWNSCLTSVGLRGRRSWHWWIQQPNHFVRLPNIVSYLRCQPLELIPSHSHRSQKPTGDTFRTCYLHPYFLHCSKLLVNNPKSFLGLVPSHASVIHSISSDQQLWAGVWVYTVSSRGPVSMAGNSFLDFPR